ncbi:hypothetical protein JCGZ_27019 [Jatropha curcas]|uniref:DRBM domain-containing protein n=1 Tax=Jatropha curcas TaxID=180498 RepID=A0A067L0K5_JATCU|nr:ribonuclease 3-like protein 1 [Jatropha curcas]KDP42001.1 hypothetical protein JCGZ_27019 [Jatropha curcas]
MEKKCHINLKNLPLPPDPAYSESQVKKIKTNFRYVPKAAKPGQEEGRKEVKFDHEANTEADLFADINIVQKQSTNEEEEEEDDASIKHIIESNNTNTSKTQVQNKLNFGRETSFDYQLGEASKVSPKSQLHEICAANNWKPPLFECCKDEGPCHLRLFTFKVLVEIKGATTEVILECFGGPRPKKKAAADHAAEGALWYLKHLGYFPIKKWQKRN